MHVSYSCIRKKLSLFSKQLTVMAGLVLLPITLRLEKVQAKPAPPVTPRQPLTAPNPDPRIIRLKKFFARLHCPVLELADDFVHAADENQLDWRLLPSISVIESGGGKAYRNNNVFGWNNGQQLFPSIRAGIHTVAFKLGKSPLYEHRDSVGKLRLYNPNEDYVNSVVQVMNRISPVENLRKVQHIVRRQNEFVYATD